MSRIAHVIYSFCICKSPYYVVAVCDYTGEYVEAANWFINVQHAFYTAKRADCLLTFNMWLRLYIGRVHAGQLAFDTKDDAVAFMMLYGHAVE